MAKYLFGTGTARGGTGLATRMLSVSPKIEIALDPYLALYRSFRSAAVRHFGSEKLKGAYDSSAPMQSYYFSEIEREVMNCIFNAPLDLPFEKKERTTLIETLRKRALLSSGDLSPMMDKMDGKTYAEWFETGLELIAHTRQKAVDWVGIHENWTVECMVPLAKHFKDAKFMVVLRDPRAVIASNMKVSDPSLRGHIVSYARSLRKLMGMTRYFQSMPLFQNRLHVVKFEDLVLEPEKGCQRMCEFLGTKYLPDMLDTSKYLEPADGSVYNGFSSFEKTAEGISTHRISRWKSNLTAAEINLIDFVIGPEMSLFGYECEKLSLADWPGQEVLQAMVADNVGFKNWRCDFQSLQSDFGYELFRKAALQWPHLPLDTKTQELSFLFPEVYAALKHQPQMRKTA